MFCSELNGEKLSVTWSKSHRKEISISRIWLDDMSTRAHKMVSSMYIYEGGGQYSSYDTECLFAG